MHLEIIASSSLFKNKTKKRKKNHSHTHMNLLRVPRNRILLHMFSLQFSFSLSIKGRLQNKDHISYTGNCIWKMKHWEKIYKLKRRRKTHTNTRTVMLDAFTRFGSFRNVGAPILLLPIMRFLVSIRSVLFFSRMKVRVDAREI